MRVYRSFDEIKHSENSIITVGTFDGVHKGHRKIIDKLLEISAKESIRPVLLTLDPHPQIVLQKPGREPVKLLTTLFERLMLFEKFGLEHVLVIPFSYEFSQTDPRVFVTNYLHGKVGFKKIIIGYDHMFGKDRGGNIELLEELGEKLDFETLRIEALTEHDTIVSSTKIRQALIYNEIEIANEMLGYEYLVSGKVVHGQGKAAKLGYPTANILPEDNYKLLPGNGVYFVKSLIDGEQKFGMANIGVRPTLTNDKVPTLEVNYFDFDKDLYGRFISVSFIKFIRYEQKFENVQKLLEQIALDKEACMSLIGSYNNNL